MSFLYPFLNFLQPGVFWPALAPYKPMLVATLIAVLFELIRTRPGDAELRRRFFLHPAFIWLGVFVVVQAISVHYGGVRGMLEELDFWGVYLLFVAASLLSIHDARSLRRYVWGMMLGSAVVVAFGLYAVAVNLPTLADGRAGAYGMYENHNDYTFIIIMVLPFAYLFLRLTRTRLAKLLLLALVVACIVGVVLSLSRGGILALVFECALILGLTTAGKRRVLAIVAVAMIGAVAINYQFSAREENQRGNYTAADAENSRYELWKAARNMLVAHPVLGIGSRRFKEYSQDYGEISHDNRGKVAHNTYMEVAADTGILGFGSFLLMLWGIFRSARGVRLADARGDGLLEVRLATFIGLCAIMLRSLLDAKAYDWSFYVLAVLGIATSILASSTADQQEAAGQKDAVRSEAARRPVVSARPVVYRQR
jgi:putative inorganic carbon (HCO3(-)) transporter